MSSVLQDVCERIERKTLFLFPILLIHESKKTGYETNYLDGFGFGFGPKRSRFCTTNIVAFASRLKRLLFVPRSTIVERGTNKIGSKTDGVEEAKMDLKISGISVISLNWTRVANSQYLERIDEGIY